MRKLVGLLLFLWALAAGAQTPYVLVTNPAMTYVPTGPSSPTLAHAQGFDTLTYTTTAWSGTNVDNAEACWNGGTGTPGVGSCPYQWYPYRLNGGNPLAGNGNTTTPGSCLPNIIFNPSGEPAGVMELDGCKTGANAQIAAGVPLSSAHTDWHGNAFGGGGYFEVEMKFADGVYQGANGWPAWWMQPYETTLVTGNPCFDTWGGTTSPSNGCTYHQNVEIDIMEYINSGMGGSLHESYGVYGTSGTCPPNYCQQNTNFNSGSYSKPTGNFGVYHKYAVLWVAATASTAGWIQFIRDGAAQTRIYWPTQFVRGSASNNAPPPTIPASVSGQNAGNSWAFGSIDTYHYLPIIGTGVVSDPTTPTPNPKIYVKGVNVWQTDATQNVSR